MTEPLIKIYYSDAMFRVYNETELLQETDVLDSDTIDFYICIEEAKKAEEEQALVIFTMLEFYKEFGKDWADKMNEMLKAG